MTNYHIQSNTLGRLLYFVALFVLTLGLSANAKKSEKHLFILSGQSNMTGGLKAGFSKTVEGAFGKDNVAVVHHCKSGRGIRFWD